MMTRICRLLRVCFALCVCLSVMGTMVGCASDARDGLEEPTAVSTAQSPQRVVRFRVLRHGSANSVNADDGDYDDKLVSLYVMGVGKVQNLRQDGLYMTFSFNSKSPLTSLNMNTEETFTFVGNLQQDTLKDVGEPLSTQTYLRKSIDDLANGLPLLAVGEVARNKFELRGGVYATKPGVEVVLKRVMALFDMQTLPFPQGYKFKSITIERLPAKFCVKGDLGGKSYEELNAENPTKYPYSRMLLWGTSADAPSFFVGFKKASYESNNKGDRVLDGTFFMPPVKAKLAVKDGHKVDPFGKSTNEGMPFLRFVFTDPKDNTLVRLFRLGNSDTAEDKMGNIDRNARYKIRIHLLGPSVVRDESLKDYDEGESKAAFVN